MSQPVSLTIDDGIGLICIDNPPVNALSPAVVDGLGAAFAQAGATAGLGAIVLYCAGRTFIAGADISAFDRPDYDRRPFVDLVAAIEASPIPVVAALHGTALGGGLETALACHWRVGHPALRIGLPEVKLGILPGAGGTQRAPRLAGLKFAADMMLTGKMVKAQAALDAGLIDEIADAEPRAAGIAAARRLVADGWPIRRTSALAIPDAGDEAERALADAAEIAAKKPVYPAPAAIVRCLRAATGPYAQGIATEGREFMALVGSPESKALRHLFFAEHEASKIPGLARDLPRRAIRKVGIIGAGTMGGGIAMNFASAGVPVTIVEAEQAALDRGLGIVRKNYEASAAKGRLTGAQVEGAMAALTGSLDYGDLADCDLVIEAVYENMALKQEIVARLGAIVKPGGIIATNTSTLDVDVLAQASGRPADVLGMHFFSPANVMRLLEIVRGAETAPDVLATIVDLAKKIGKVPVVSGVCYGFIGNRMTEAYLREAEAMLLEGAEPAQIDHAVEALGMAMGPCRMLDMAGVDVGAKIVGEWKKSGGAPADPDYRVLVERLFDRGRLGQKSGAGYYRYEGRTPVGDPELRRIADEVAAEHRIARRDAITDQEIVERLLYPLINEGCLILEEGVAYRASDIDVVWTAGYGFPDHKGGPMFWAEQIGLDTIATRLRHYGETRGDEHGYWTPAALLIEAAQSGRGLGDAKR